MTGIALAYDRSQFEKKDEKMLRDLVPRVHMVKIGLEAFTAFDMATSIGALVDRFVRACEGRVLQDWKLHDIGTTMARAATNIAYRNAFGLTVHASASHTGLEHIVEARNLVRTSEPMQLFGVTVLTDIDTEDCISLFNEQPVERVCDLAERLLEVGFDGLVCSGQELTELEKRGLLHGLKTLVPGTRPSWAPLNDQKRSMTYEEVAALGATWTVVGRAALQAPDPIEAIERIREELGL